MHRIDGPGATADNRFTLGNSGAGIDATDVTADIMNAVQEEICAVIEASGIALSKPTNTQLLEAIRRLSMSTGDVKLTIKTAADPGWVMCNDGTIGSAASSATTRAHADTEALYTLLWTNIADAHAPVTGGRGASAAADFSANKPIALTKMLGRALAVSGSGTGLTARALGSTTGTETHVLTQAETPLKSHAHAVTDPGHTHQQTNDGDNGISPTGLYTTGSNTGIGATAGTVTQPRVANISINTMGDTTASAHNNMPPESFLNAMIKL